MQRRLARIGGGAIHIRPAFDQILTKLPMSVETNTGQIEVLSQRVERFTVSQQKLDRAYIAVVGAPTNQRNAIFVFRVSRIPRGNIVEDKVSAAVHNLIEHAYASSGRSLARLVLGWIVRGVAPLLSSKSANDRNRLHYLALQLH